MVSLTLVRIQARQFFTLEWCVAMARRRRLNILRRPSLARLRPECLNCGFLGFANSEVHEAARVEFGAWIGGTMSPNYAIDDLECTKRLWVKYELTYFGLSAEGIKDELSQERRNCPGFMSHRPGYSPEDHKGIQRDNWRTWRNLRANLIVGVIGGSAGAALTWLLTRVF